MIKSIIMTYLIVGNKEENIKGNIKSILKGLWERDLNDDVFDNNNPDIHILCGSNIKSIGIEDVKAFQKEMMFSPFKELIQIGIIFDAQKLTTQAQNSLLKTLEESSNTTTYILTTNNEMNLLPTVLSRCSKIYTKEEKEEKVNLEFENIFELDLIKAFKAIEEIAKERESTLIFLTNYESYLQSILEDKIKQEKETKEIYNSVGKVINARRKIEANGNRRLILESLYLDLTTQFAS